MDLAVIGLATALVVFFVGVVVVLTVKGSDSAPTAFWAAGGAISGGLLGLLARPPGDTPNPNTVAGGLAADLTQTAAVRAATQAATQHAAQPQVTAEALVAIRRRGALAVREARDNVDKQDALGVSADSGAVRIAQSHQEAAATAAQELANAQTALGQAQTAAAPGAPNQAQIQEAQAAVEAAAAKSDVLAAAAQGADAERLDATSSAVNAAVTAPASATPASVAGWLFVLFCALLALAVVLATGQFALKHSVGPGPIDNITKTAVALASAAGSGLIGLYAPSPTATGAGAAGSNK